MLQGENVLVIWFEYSFYFRCLLWQFENENNKIHPDTQTEQRRLISVHFVEKCLAKRQNTHSPFKWKINKSEISEKPLSLRNGKVSLVKISKFETSQQWKKKIQRGQLVTLVSRMHPFCTTAWCSLFRVYVQMKLKWHSTHNSLWGASNLLWSVEWQY